MWKEICRTKAQWCGKLFILMNWYSYSGSESKMHWFHCILCIFDMLETGLGSIPFFQFNSNSYIFNSNSNSNSTTYNKFQFQFQFQRFQFQFQFQFQRFQIQPQFQKWPVEVFREIDYNYDNKVHVAVYKIIVINTISLISLVKWL